MIRRGRAASFVAGLLAPVVLSWGGSARADDCGIFPEAVHEQSIYGGFSDCTLAAYGEPPLWNGVPPGAVQVMRFSFTDGHFLFFRAVTITQRADGTAELVAIGSERRSGIRTPEKRLPARRMQLSAEQVARLNRLAEESATWQFEVGSWDGEGLYLHCQSLDMERANAEGYRFASVNIGCNQPAKLMPLIDEIAGLAGLQRDGGLFY